MQTIPNRHIVQNRPIVLTRPNISNYTLRGNNTGNPFEHTIPLTKVNNHNGKGSVTDLDNSELLTQIMLNSRMHSIRQFASAAKPWFEHIMTGEPLERPMPSSITEPLRQWLGALCDSRQVLYQRYGDPINADIELQVHGPSIMSAMEKTPEERKAIMEAGGADSLPKPGRNQIEFTKSAMFTIDCERSIYRLNDLNDRISKQPNNKLNPQSLEAKTAELIYFISCALQRHAMLMNVAERRAFVKWLEKAESMLGDIYEYGEGMARTTAQAGRMKKTVSN